MNVNVEMQKEFLTRADENSTCKEVSNKMSIETAMANYIRLSNPQLFYEAKTSGVIA